VINNLIAYSRDKHLKKSGAGNKLVQGFTVGMDENGIVTVAGEVTEFQNNLGDGGAPFDFDVILGTPANLRKSISDACLFYGASGDFVTQPDSEAADITGDIQIIAKCVADDWTPASEKQIAAKMQTTSTRSWRWDLLASGAIALLTTTGGGAGTQVSGVSSVPVPFSDGEEGWLKVTLDVDDGAGNRVYKFFTSTDTTNDPDAVNFTQLGTTVTTAGTTSIFKSTSQIEIGSSFNGGNFMWDGIIHRVSVYNGIDGEKVVDFNPALYVNKLTDTTFNSSLMALDLTGAVGDFGDTPDSIILRVTGDIDLRADLFSDDWTKTITVIAKDLGVQRGYRLNVELAGSLQVGVSTSAGSITFKRSTVATGFTDGTRHRIRATVDVDNGAGGFDVTFFVDPADPLNPDITLADGTTWDQLGDVVTTAGVISITAATSPLQIGSLTTGSFQILAGAIFKIEVFNGIDGQIVADMDASKFISGSTIVGLKRLNLPGGAGNFASTPNAAANRITGDIDVAVKVLLSDYTPASAVTFLSKFATIANQRSYVFLINTLGELELQTFSNGQVGSITTHKSSIPVPTLDNTVIFFRASLDVDNGAGDSECTFYTSSDGFNWTQLGEIFRSGGVVSIHPGTAPVELGSSNAGADDVMTGLMLRAVIINGIFDEGGTLAVSYNPTDFVSGTTQTSLLTSEVWTEQGTATLAEIWTANGAAAFVGQWLLNGDTFIQNTGNDVVHTIGGVGLETTLRQLILNPGTVFLVGRHSGTPAADQTFFYSRSIVTEIWGMLTREGNDDRFAIFQGGSEVLLSEPFDTDAHVHSGQFNGDATTKLIVSDVGTVTGDCGPDDWDFGTMCAQTAGAGSLKGFFAALYVYPIQLTDQQIEHNISVLETRYNL